MTAIKSDPALTLAQRIYIFKQKGEAWTTAVDRYAREVLLRHPRTVHRWLSGESPIPAVVADAFTDLDAYENSVAPLLTILRASSLRPGGNGRPLPNWVGVGQGFLPIP